MISGDQLLDIDSDFRVVVIGLLHQGIEGLYEMIDIKGYRITDMNQFIGGGLEAFLGHHLLLRLRVLDEDGCVLADERHRIVRLMVLGHVWRRDEDGRLPGGAELGDRAGA